MNINYYETIALFSMTDVTACKVLIIKSYLREQNLQNDQTFPLRRNTHWTFSELLKASTALK